MGWDPSSPECKGAYNRFRIRSFVASSSLPFSPADEMWLRMRRCYDVSVFGFLCGKGAQRETYGQRQCGAQASC